MLHLSLDCCLWSLVGKSQEHRPAFLNQERERNTHNHNGKQGEESLSVFLLKVKMSLNFISSDFIGESGLLDSNQRPHRPERRALPTALNPVWWYL